MRFSRSTVRTRKRPFTASMEKRSTSQVVAWRGAPGLGGFVVDYQHRRCPLRSSPLKFVNQPQSQRRGARSAATSTAASLWFGQRLSSGHRRAARSGKIGETFFGVATVSLQVLGDERLQQLIFVGGNRPLFEQDLTKWAALIAGPAIEGGDQLTAVNEVVLQGKYAQKKVSIGAHRTKYIEPRDRAIQLGYRSSNASATTLLAPWRSNSSGAWLAAW